MVEKQFTATAYVLQDRQVLLIFHKKLEKWLPPGGHLHADELPPEAAIREVFEETGLNVELIKQENIWINRWNASSFIRPYMCLLEEIPEHNGTPAHQHIDFIYLAKPVGGSENKSHREVGALRWFTPEEIETLRDDRDIFLETKETLRHIFAEN